jgi:uncharacterized protein (TIGR03083 family)
VAETLVLLAAERRATADLLESLDAAQLATQSLCDAWTVRDVIAHLTLSLSASVPASMMALARSAFRPSQMVVRMTEDAARRSDAEMAALLRDRAERAWHPPGLGLEAPLTDIVVHGLDIRQPLGLSHEPDPAAVRAGLGFVVRPKAGLFAKRSSHRALRFEATDLDWSHGAGPTVRGPGLAILAALCGRRVVLDQLEGDGVSTLRERIG